VATRRCSWTWATPFSVNRCCIFKQYALLRNIFRYDQRFAEAPRTMATRRRSRTEPTCALRDPGVSTLRHNCLPLKDATSRPRVVPSARKMSIYMSCDSALKSAIFESCKLHEIRHVRLSASICSRGLRPLGLYVSAERLDQKDLQSFITLKSAASQASSSMRCADVHLSQQPTHP
jgi:hypothetical protein